MSTPRREGIRPAHLVGLAVAVLVIGWVGLSLWVRAGHGLPPVSWPGALVPLLLGLLVLALGDRVRKTIAGRAERPVEPIGAARTLLTAQAGAATGATAAGWYAAQLLHRVPDIDVASNRTTALALAGYVVTSGFLCGAGLLVQKWCRIDRGRGGQDDDASPSS